MENPTLLQQSIIEGSADFIGELISGRNIYQEANDYGNRNEERLCREFVSRMDSANYIDWLYGVSGKTTGQMTLVIGWVIKLPNSISGNPWIRSKL